MYGGRVAEARRGKKLGVIELRYTPTAIAEYGLNVPLLSCSLRTDDRWIDATAFISGLLPEGRARDEMARRANVAASDIHGLLARFGRDAVGALSVVPAGESATDGGGAEEYTDESLATAIEELGANPLGLHDDSQLSLPGMQEKLLLIKTKTGWARPIRGQPSTHILKRDHAVYQGLVALEAECLRLAHRVDLTSIDPVVVAGDPRDYLIVDRYDRQVDDRGNVVRIHQEDLCQAMGIHTFSNDKAKDEATGGPRLADLASLLATYARDPDPELDRLMRAVVFTVAIGNADAHGKNMSLVHQPDGSVALAPLYDTVPTLMWPKLKTTPGMFVGGCRDIRNVTRSHLIAEATTWGVSEPTATACIADTASRLHDAVSELQTPSVLADLVRLQLDKLN